MNILKALFNLFKRKISITKKSVNLRRRLKILEKDAQRKFPPIRRPGRGMVLISKRSEYVCKELAKIGLLGDFYDIGRVLRSKVRSGTLARLGRAALSKNGLFDLRYVNAFPLHKIIFVPNSWKNHCWKPYLICSHCGYIVDKSKCPHHPNGEILTISSPSSLLS
jgi:hypothetical protein